MGIGFRELIVLMFLFAVLCIAIVGAIWLATRRNRSRSSLGSQRPAADRLAELESLRQAGHISTAEYEKQRASIISGVCAAPALDEQRRSALARGSSMALSFNASHRRAVTRSMAVMLGSRFVYPIQMVFAPARHPLLPRKPPSDANMRVISPISGLPDRMAEREGRLKRL